MRQIDTTKSCNAPKKWGANYDRLIPGCEGYYDGLMMVLDRYCDKLIPSTIIKYDRLMMIYDRLIPENACYYDKLMKHCDRLIPEKCPNINLSHFILRHFSEYIDICRNINIMVGKETNSNIRGCLNERTDTYE